MGGPACGSGGRKNISKARAEISRQGREKVVEREMDQPQRQQPLGTVLIFFKVDSSQHKLLLSFQPGDGA